MSNKLGKTAALIMAGTTLLSGAFVELPTAFNATVTAHASSKIPYSTYSSDLNGEKAALAKADSTIQEMMPMFLPDSPSDAYKTNYVGSFAGYIENLGQQISSYSISTPEAWQADLNCLNASYEVFKTRLSSGTQAQLEALSASIEKEIKSNDADLNIITLFDDYGQALSEGINEYNAAHDGVAAKPKATAKKSSITKLTAKRTDSKKYVKVTGTAKLYKTANYAHIKTYKGYRYAKLTSKHTFSKTIYAPKAKSVRVTVGHYSNGHFTAVTSARTASVK